MYIARIAYRHVNGEVEGFIGTSLVSASAADVNAQKEIQEKISIARLPCFDSSRVIRHPSVITTDEYETIRRDWLTYHKPGSAILPKKSRTLYFSE